MAYCSKCGAYIPDGQKVCVACGFDPEAEQKQAAQAQAQAAAYAAAAAAAEPEIDPRADVERRRAERQESNRAWAENERRRRQMEEQFKRAQEEKERRAESYVHRDGKRVNVNIGDGVKVNVDDDRVSINIGGRRYTIGSDGAAGNETGEETRGFEEEETRDLGDEIREKASKTANKGLAAISYLGVLVFVPLLVGSEDTFIKFHARQGLKLFAYTALGSALGSFIGVGWIATLLGAGLAIKGVLDAINGKMEQLPILNKLKWF